MITEIQQRIDKIYGLNEQEMKLALTRLNHLTKPLGSLGKLEDIACQLAGITGNHELKAVNKAFVVVSSNDIFTASSLGILAEQANARLLVTNNHVERSTEESIVYGMIMAEHLAKQGTNVIGLCVIGSEGSNLKLQDVLTHKRESNPCAIIEMIDLQNVKNLPTLTGLILGAAARKMLVVLDGLTTALAGLAAVRMAPNVGGYLLASQLTDQKGHREILDELSLTPMMQLNMTSGQGVGTTLGLSMVDAAIAVFTQMATFDEARVAYALSDISKGEKI